MQEPSRPSRPAPSPSTPPLTFNQRIDRYRKQRGITRRVPELAYARLLDRLDLDGILTPADARLLGLSPAQRRRAQAKANTAKRREDMQWRKGRA